MFGYCSPWVNDRPWYMQPLWNISGCCPDVEAVGTDSARFFALARAIFGYQASCVPLIVWQHQTMSSATCGQAAFGFITAFPQS
jgi:hypothetical protein